MTKELSTIVYPWIARMARGNELRFSLRSVELNFAPPVEVWLVGDMPEWYAGNFLPCPVYDETLCLPRQDRAKKLAAVIDEPRIAETFLWMMDDIYFVRPITLAQLRLPWICGEMQPQRLDDWKPAREWTRQKKLTWQALRDNGKPLFDFSTHLPYVYEKSKLKILYQKYGLPDSPYIDDILYMNEFQPFTQEPQDSKTILYRETRRPSAEILRRRLKQEGIQVFNHVDRSFSPEVEQVLIELFPLPCQWEKTK